MQHRCSNLVANKGDLRNMAKNGFAFPRLQSAIASRRANTNVQYDFQTTITRLRPHWKYLHSMLSYYISQFRAPAHNSETNGIRTPGKLLK